MPPKGNRHVTLQDKKQRVAERKLRKVEKKRQEKRDYLGREVRYGQLTYKNYEKNWKEMLVKIALPRMRADLEFAWHNFERVIDCKDFTISLLMDEIRDSEEQYMHNFRDHSENIENLMILFYDRLEELKNDFDFEVKVMGERCDGEFLQINETNTENWNYVKTMMYELELQRKEYIRLQRGEYFSILDEVDVKNQLLMQKLKANLENKYLTMFEDMKQFSLSYNKQIKDRKKEHNDLKAADDALQEVISHQFKQIKKFYDIVRQLKQKYIDMKQTEGSKLLDAQEERNYFSNSFLTLKIKLENDKKEDFHKLVTLSKSCTQVFDRLENLNKKGEMILSLAAVCRKLETLKEKILPFPLYRAYVPENNMDDDTDDYDDVRPEMELFWQRLGQAHGTHYVLSREKKCLTEENEILIDTHNDYCEKMMFPVTQRYVQTVTIPKSDLSIVSYKCKKFKNVHHSQLFHRNKSGTKKNP